jgi:hypothetical protein
MVLDHEITIVKEKEIPEAAIRLRSDGIMHVHYKKDTTLDVELQLRMRDEYRKLIGEKRTRFIFSAEEGFILTKEARENSKKLNEQPPISAYAIIANNLAYRIIGNFYLRVNKPQIPYKLFSNIIDAARWLHQLSDQ